MKSISLGAALVLATGCYAGTPPIIEVGGAHLDVPQGAQVGGPVVQLSHTELGDVRTVRYLVDVGSVRFQLVAMENPPGALDTAGRSAVTERLLNGTLSQFHLRDRRPCTQGSHEGEEFWLVREDMRARMRIFYIGERTIMLVASFRDEAGEQRAVELLDAVRV